MKKFIFRFDIDTHKCIRDGVPNLINLSRKYDVPFTFYLNTGRAVSFKDSMQALVHHASDSGQNIQMMGARQKLGNGDYLIAAILNPIVSKYQKQIKLLLESKCEMGIHGGDNHALWQLYADQWTEEKIAEEIQRAVARIRNIDPNYSLSGFASPAWNSPECLSEVLKTMGFQYYADLHTFATTPIRTGGALPNIGVNLFGEPGGVAFWESCRVKGMNDQEIVQLVDRVIDENEIVIVYDHPYYAGVQEIRSISQVLEHVLERGCDITTVQKIAEFI